MRAPQATMFFNSEEDRRKLTGWFGVPALLGWVVAESFFELLFGPHVRLVRSLALGSGIGAAVGLLTSGLQWLALRGRVRGAGRLVPATTVCSTLAGLFGGLLLYTLIHTVEFHRLALPLQGVAGAVLVGSVTALGQWVVLKSWAATGRERRSWTTTVAVGAALGAVSACIAAALTMGVLAAFLDRGAWPYIWIAAYLVGGIAGGAVFGRSITLGLRRVLGGASTALGSPAHSPRRVAQASMRPPRTEPRPSNAYPSTLNR